jgi:acyl-CoA thioesterase
MSERKKQARDHGLENYQFPDCFGDWLGYRVVSVDSVLHRAEVELKIRKDHLSPARRVHGGVVSAFFDMACGAAVFSTMSAKDFCSTVELKVNYLRPIELDDVLLAKTEVVFLGKRLCVLHGYAYRNDEAAPVAMVSATYNVVRLKNKNQ